MAGRLLACWGLNPDFYDASAVLNQLTYKANWEPVDMWVENVLVDDLHISSTISDEIYSPLTPQYNVDYCQNNLLRQHNDDFCCEGYLPKSIIVRGEGAGGLFKNEIYIEKPIAGTFL